MREENGANAAPSQVRDVRQEQVDAEMLVPREGEAGVDDEELVGDLVDGHVLAHLAEPAEGDDPQGLAHGQASVPGAGRGRRRAVLICD